MRAKESGSLRGVVEAGEFVDMAAEDAACSEEVFATRLAVWQIIEQTGQCYGVATGDIICSSRLASLVWPRHVSMYLVRQELALSYPQIARCFERDHSTVIYACRKIAARLETDFSLRESIEAIRSDLAVAEAG